MNSKEKTNPPEENLPEITMKLTSKLRELLDEDEFVNGSLNCVQDEESQAMLLDFIERGQDVTVSSVAILAFKLACQGARKMKTA